MILWTELLVTPTCLSLCFAALAVCPVAPQILHEGRGLFDAITVWEMISIRQSISWIFSSIDFRQALAAIPLWNAHTYLFQLSTGFSDISDWFSIIHCKYFPGVCKHLMYGRNYHNPRLAFFIEKRWLKKHYFKAYLVYISYISISAIILKDALK